MTRTILIVEDDDDIAECMREFLRDEGYDARVAANGQEALDHLRSHEAPALIILDLLMPVMDGIELLDRLRAERDLASIPVLVVSASSTIQTPQGVPILRKPFELAEFLATVRAHCPPDRDAGSP